MERLPGELLLEPDALGDVAGVEDDAADVPVVAQVGDVGLEVCAIRRTCSHAEQHSCGLAVLERRGDRGAVVGIDEASKPAPSSLRVSDAEHRADGLAHVAAAARAEDEHQVGRAR